MEDKQKDQMYRKHTYRTPKNIPSGELAIVVLNGAHELLY